MTVVTGFLGAGKTTLVKHFLQTSEGRGTAVVVNEFGAVGIDNALLRSSADETILLGNGCLCCNVRSDLQLALRRLISERERGQVPHFGRIVIETSGLADPSPILRTFATDRALGDEFTYRLLSRVQDSVVQAIGGAVTLYVLDEVARVLERGTYTRNVAAALAENRAALEDMVVEKVGEDPRARRLQRLPFYDDIVRAVTRAVLDVATGILKDPRTDELVADLLRENLNQIREAVRQDEQARGHLRGPTSGLPSA